MASSFISFTSGIPCTYPHCVMETKHSINVLNPERHGGDGLNTSYVSYEIVSKVDKEYKVRRRYQDFLWLFDQLKHDYPERIIPPLPEKNRLEYLGRFTPDFIKRRQLALKRFLLRIDGHAELGNCEVFLNFLRLPVVGMSSRDRSFDSQTSINGDDPSGSSVSLTSSYLKPVLDSLTDVTISIFSRSPKSVPEAFSSLRKEVKMIRNHLSQLERLFSNRVMGYQPAIIEGMKEIAGNFDELSASIDLSLNFKDRPIEPQQNICDPVDTNDPEISPSFVKSMLSRVSATMTQCAHLLDKSIDDQELNLLAVLLEYTQYCDSALEIIDMRDRRQVEVEELSQLILGYEKELKELEGGGGISSSNAVVSSEDNTNDTKNTNNTNDNTSSTDNTATSNSTSNVTPNSTAISSKTNFFDYLSSKWDSWKGVDPITARQNRLQKCKSRLSDAQTALKISSTLSTRADSALSDEVATFIALMKVELGKEFENHGKAQVKYHETSLVYWKDFLAWLDNPPKHL